jgi:tetratricopeptide (TPR) repeat protein
MTLDSRFWALFFVFQVFFGLAVFAITREYYMQDEEVVSGHPWTTDQSAPSWSQGITATDVSRLTAPAVKQSVPSDPAEISRMADEAFVNKQYDRAALLYEQLLAFDSGNAEIYNNLGLTLHYLGRSDEAVQRLNEGVEVDAEHQRIWLTLGFVNAQLGNVGQARAALTKAIQVGSNESIRQSATKMLEELP